MKVKRKNLTKITTLLLCLITLSSIAQNKKYNVIYTNTIVDSLPKYSTYTRDVYAFISNNFYVSFLMTNKEGNSSEQCILVDFIIDSVGNVSDVHFGSESDIHFNNYTDYNCLKSRSPYVEKEIARIFDKMPSWQPAYKDGKPITIRVYMPIHYMMYNRLFIITNKEEEVIIKNNKNNLDVKLLVIAIALTFFLYKFSK